MNDCIFSSLCVNEVETKVYARKLINFYSLVNIACYNPSHKDYPLEGNKPIKWGVEFLEKAGF